MLLVSGALYLNIELELRLNASDLRIDWLLNNTAVVMIVGVVRLYLQSGMKY